MYIAGAILMCVREYVHPRNSQVGSLLFLDVLKWGGDSVRFSPFSPISTILQTIPAKASGQMRAFSSFAHTSHTRSAGVTSCSIFSSPSPPSFSYTQRKFSRVSAREKSDREKSRSANLLLVFLPPSRSLLKSLERALDVSFLSRPLIY